MKPGSILAGALAHLSGRTIEHCDAFLAPLDRMQREAIRYNRRVAPLADWGQAMDDWLNDRDWTFSDSACPYPWDMPE